MDEATEKMVRDLDELEERIANFTQILIEPMGKPNWMPIDTAPKNGTPILGAIDTGVITTVQWVWDLQSDTGYWNLCVSGAFAENGEWTPQYWMPLPKAHVADGARESMLPEYWLPVPPDA